MNWRPIADYVAPPWDMGPDVLLAWKERNSLKETVWMFGVGYGRWELDTPPHFCVGEWDVEPLFFAVIEPPKEEP